MHDGGDGAVGGEHPGRHPRHVGGGDVKSGETQRDRTQDHQKILRTTGERRAVSEHRRCHGNKEDVLTSLERVCDIQ